MRSFFILLVIGWPFAGPTRERYLSVNGPFDEKTGKCRVISKKKLPSDVKKEY